MPPPLPALWVGAATAITGFVVVLGSSAPAPAIPASNVDALSAAAQDYLPHLEQGALTSDHLDAALLVAQIDVSDPTGTDSNLVADQRPRCRDRGPRARFAAVSKGVRCQAR
jgi:hypothetical protein